ncbi:MAG: hypothetical protein J6C78_04600 [Muribaculaceae bacterium]|nr:hypothetical protein [Muribaculaceae bacterium]
MRKIFTAIAMAFVVLCANAESPVSVFNHLGAGIGFGTTGVSFEVATPITHWVQLRAGLSWMPSITFNSDADYTLVDPVYNTTHDGTVDLKGDLGRTQGQVIFNLYPMSHNTPLYVAAGAYFGGGGLLKITGHSDEMAGENAEVIIGDYRIPANADGDISGGLRVKKFRPYLGLGWGSSIPGRFMNFVCELGVQFQGKSEVYTDYGEIDESMLEDDNTFNKVREKLTVYPTLTFKFNFKAF